MISLGPTSATTTGIVLVVDDSQTIRRSAEALLAREGFAVVTAPDGFEALSLVVEHRPQVVLLDIMMPRLDGYQVCALIKSHPDFATIAVILLSSKDGVFDRARGELSGCDGYLTKPFNREDLMGALKGRIGRVL